MSANKPLDVLEADGGWLTPGGVAAAAEISEQAAHRALYRLRNDGKAESRFRDGRNEFRYVDGAIPPVDEETEIPMEKTCSRCKETKSAREFGKNKRTKDGLSWYCKACMKERYEEKKAKKKGKAAKAQPDSKPEPSFTPADEDLDLPVEKDATEPGTDSHWCIAELRDPRLSTIEQARKFLVAKFGDVSLEDAAEVLAQIADLDLA